MVHIRVNDLFEIVVQDSRRILGLRIRCGFCAFSWATGQVLGQILQGQALPSREICLESQTYTIPNVLVLPFFLFGGDSICVSRGTGS